MIVIHGDNKPQSRLKLLELITQAKNQGRDVVRVEAASLQLARLEEVLGASDLFGQPKTIVIEGLHSLVKSKKKDELIKATSSAVATLPDHIDVMLWESRSLTKTMLKQFSHAQEFEFKVSSVVFKWLDSLSPAPATKTKQLTLFHQATDSEDEFMCLAMLIRQIRLLIQARDGGQLKGAPFMITKLRSQANAFKLEQLLSAHTKLLEIDTHQKTSSSLLNLRQELDLFLLQL